MSPRVALIGANGHGLSHRRVMAPLHAAGALELVALCDLAPVRDEPDAPVPPGTRVLTDYRELLTAARPDVVVICTPPHTHLEIATAAARAGADLLLEKPPVLSGAEHVALARVLAGTGRVCQVGFQALGSAALAELTAALAAGALGRVTGIGVAGAWQRPDGYYQRASWAGRSRLNGRPVLDGALANPFAHAVMQCFAIAETVVGGPVVLDRVELERYRARPIEVDDTAVLRVTLDNGLPVVVAVTLCGDEYVSGDVIVHGERGRAMLQYPTDLLRLPGNPAPREVPGRIGLLENLLAHRASLRPRPRSSPADAAPADAAPADASPADAAPADASPADAAPESVPLLAALARTAPFTATVERVAVAPEPTRIGTSHLVVHGGGAARVVTVAGVSDVMRRAADRLALPSELGAAWAAAPYVS